MKSPSRTGNARPPFNRVLLSAGVVLAIAAALLAVYVSGHYFIPQDAVVERDVQSVQWGPLALTFPFFSWIGDAKGAVAEAILFVVVLIVNRRAWLVAAGAATTAGWYVLLSHVIHRPRPTTAQVLQVTEHPGSWSFPSGHTMFVTTIAVVLVVCIAYRFARGWVRIVAWIVAVFLIVANGISRIYVGVHWPTDVLAGILIASAWMCVWFSFGPVYRRIVSAQSGLPGRHEPSLRPRRQASSE